jgi:hypothetical protein
MHAVIAAIIPEGSPQKSEVAVLRKTRRVAKCKLAKSDKRAVWSGIRISACFAVSLCCFVVICYR